MIGRLFRIVLTHRSIDHLYRWCSSQICADNLSWDICLVLWRKFHFCCGTTVSSICVTNYIVYISVESTNYLVYKNPRELLALVTSQRRISEKSCRKVRLVFRLEANVQI